MPGTTKIWSSLQQLAAALRPGATLGEAMLDHLEDDLIQHPKAQRDLIRREMIFIVANLSRLESRLMTAEGPLGNANRPEHC